MGSLRATYTCPSSLSSKMCAVPLTMFTWRSDLFELSRFADNFLVNNFTWRVNLDCVHLQGVDIIIIDVKQRHFQGNLKQKTCDDLAKYVKRDERLPQVLLSPICCLINT